MMKRVVLFAFLTVFLLAFIVSAQGSDSKAEDDLIDDSYTCLENLIEGRETLTFSQAVFSSLALGAEKKAVDKLEEDKDTENDCWPDNCKIKETSQALLAYDRMNKNTDGIIEWLFENNKTSTDLNWFLQIDIDDHARSECKIRYGSQNKEVVIGEDLKISGDAGTCLSVNSDGYWLSIRPSCLDETFEVSCEGKFLTSLLYTKDSGETVYVSSETHSGQGLDDYTEEKVESQCFGTRNGCDYEGTLWAALALANSGEDIDKFIPYLVASAEDNRKYFPSAFLNMIFESSGRDSQKYFDDLVRDQKTRGYWEFVGSPGDRFYDTSLAMLALSNQESFQLQSAKEYLLDIRSEEGCWDSNSIQSTAFVLYSGWPKAAKIGSGNGGGSSTRVDCESAGRYCESELNCKTIGGLIDNSFYCPGFSSVCCSSTIEDRTCSELIDSEVCSSNEFCNGENVAALDGACCIGTCETRQETNVCELSGDTCRTSCFDSEEETGDSCGDTGPLVCCTESEEPVDEGNDGGVNWILVVFLIILIVLAVLGIIYRNKIRLWWFSRKGKVKSGPVSPSGGPRPGPRFGPPGAAPGRMLPMRRPIMPPRPVNKTTPTKGGKPFGKDRELEETMKKLREMSK